MSHTYHELLEPGRDGDTSVSLTMTARQVAILELLVDTAVDYGVGNLVIEAVADVLGEKIAERARLEFDIGQKRVGIGMCRALKDEDYAAVLSAQLALLDGEVAGL